MTTDVVQQSLSDMVLFEENIFVGYFRYIFFLDVGFLNQVLSDRQENTSFEGAQSFPSHALSALSPEVEETKRKLSGPKAHNRD